MVVSVKETESNPYYLLYEENENGFLQKSKKLRGLVRRQDCPKVYEINGAIYVINIKKLKKTPISEFTKIVKYQMNTIDSIDLDTQLDWDFCEFLIEKNKIKIG